MIYVTLNWQKTISYNNLFRFHFYGNKIIIKIIEFEVEFAETHFCNVRLLLSLHLLRRDTLLKAV